MKGSTQSCRSPPGPPVTRAAATGAVTRAETGTKSGTETGTRTGLLRNCPIHTRRYVSNEKLSIFWIRVVVKCWIKIVMCHVPLRASRSSLCASSCTFRPRPPTRPHSLTCATSRCLIQPPLKVDSQKAGVTQGSARPS